MSEDGHWADNQGARGKLHVLAGLLRKRGFRRELDRLISQDGQTVVWTGPEDDRTCVTFKDLDGQPATLHIDGPSYGAQVAIVALLSNLFNERPSH